jgi:hypothetical protein
MLESLAGGLQLGAVERFAAEHEGWKGHCM